MFILKTRGSMKYQVNNVLATVQQLQVSGSQLDGIPKDLEISIIFAGAWLTQCAGVLLRLPQNIVAQAIILFTRFWVGPEGGSIAEFGAKDVSAAALYMCGKVSAFPQSAKSILNVYFFLDSFPVTFFSHSLLQKSFDISVPLLSEGSFHALRTLLFKVESRMLRILGFQIQISLPHTLYINYLQALDVSENPRFHNLAKRALAHLNSALLSPQYLYLTHHPNALATAAIYLAAKESTVKLPSSKWWEVFDVDREELGFLVAAMTSMHAFASDESQKWNRRKVPLKVAEVEEAITERNCTRRDR